MYIFFASVGYIFHLDSYLMKIQEKVKLMLLIILKCLHCIVSILLGLNIYAASLIWAERWESEALRDNAMNKNFRVQK